MRFGLCSHADSRSSTDLHRKWHGLDTRSKTAPRCRRSRPCRSPMVVHKPSSDRRVSLTVQPVRTTGGCDGRRWSAPSSHPPFRRGTACQHPDQLRGSVVRRWRRSVAGRLCTAGLQQFQDPVGVLADGGDVAEHPLRRGVVGHRLEPFLPVDIPHLWANRLASAPSPASPANTAADTSTFFMSRSSIGTTAASRGQGPRATSLRPYPSPARCQVGKPLACGVTCLRSPSARSDFLIAPAGHHWRRGSQTCLGTWPANMCRIIL
jgi:hypothetical protein